MAENIEPKEMSNEQVFLHKGFATLKLKDAWLSLTAVELCGKCIAHKTVTPALIRDAVVQYGSTFKFANINRKQKHKLDDSIIPKEYQSLHRQMIKYRDQIYAHIDFEARNPVKVKDEKNISYKISDSSLQDCINNIPTMKALILHILQKLGNELIDEHQRMLHNEFDDKII
ncbi:MAG: hypothetical protein A2Y10_06435 [Planctomycetes bacterium GWF2_41_51]|nr:MAG: hypothetical protein A2Y10_06435 [Planctomycetes bacterium GWF2_41_51]HBG26406.1 hypothetical protein [Phycisphaerales bacterium]